MKYQIDEHEIRCWWQTFHPNNDWVEIRKIHPLKSGYFNDVDTLINELKKDDACNVFATFNELDTNVQYREQHQKIVYVKNTSSDNDVTKRRFILVDIDPNRKSGESATDEEKAKAWDVITNISTSLQDCGFGCPILVDSGNGYHLYYPLNPDEWENTPENTNLVKDFLKCLDANFSNEGAKVDVSVFNASRIAKVPGTWAVKGTDTPERPHRKAHGSDLNAGCHEITQRATIQQYVDANKEQHTQAQAPTQKSYRAKFNIDDFIKEHGIELRSDEPYQGGRKIVLKQCPFNPEHKGKDSAIFVTPTGAIGFKCFHDHCSGKTWKDVRRLYEPDYNPVNAQNFTQGTRRDVEYQTAKNSANSEVLAQEKNEIETIVTNAFQQTFDVDWWRKKREQRTEGIEIGYTIRQKTMLKDDKFIDVPIKLPQQGFGMIAGMLGHGKTSVICNIIINIVERYPDKKIALFVYEEDVFDIHIRLANILLGKCYSKDEGIYNNDLIAEYLTADIKHQTADNANFDKVLEHFKELINTHRIVILNEGKLSRLDSLTNAIRKAKEDYPDLCAVFIDHIQLLQGDKHKERYAEVGEIANELERLAINEVHIPIMVATQFNRGAKNVSTISDTNIGTSYEISQASNLTIGIFNSEAQNEGDLKDDDESTIGFGFQYDSNNKPSGKPQIVLKVLKCRGGYIRRNTHTVLDVNKASQKMTNAKQEENPFN